MITINISVSGGRTSAYMAWWMLNNKPQVADHLGCTVTDLDYQFTFANTGMEHEDTLRFLDCVDRHLLENRVVWLEGVVQYGERKSTQHRIVTYETAFRNDQWRDPLHPFHAVIKKYGVSNLTWKCCTREMKLHAMNSYRKSLHPDGYYTAIGIRADEARRVSKNADAGKILYPLVDLHPCDKEDVLDWFGEFDWDLAIPEWQGNCTMCFQKSLPKLNAVYNETPEAFEFTAYMEKEYGRTGYEFKDGNPDQKERVFFREHRSTEDMIAIFKQNPSDPERFINVLDDAGCSESCEMYQTEFFPLERAVI